MYFNMCVLLVVSFVLLLVVFCVFFIVLCVLVSSYVYLLYYVCIAVFTLDAGLLLSVFGRSCDHPPRHRFFLFPCVYKQMLRWFPTFQVATTCFLCSPPDLNLLVTNFIFCTHVK